MPQDIIQALPVSWVYCQWHIHCTIYSVRDSNNNGYSTLIALVHYTSLSPNCSMTCSVIIMNFIEIETVIPVTRVMGPAMLDYFMLCCVIDSGSTAYYFYTHLLRWKWWKYFTYFFLCTNQSVFRSYFDPRLPFLLESSEAEISIDITVQSSRDAQYLI